MVVIMTSYYVSIKTQGRSMQINVPAGWTVGRMKELILMYHSEAPAIRSQALSFNGEIMKNSIPLKTYFALETQPEVVLNIENLPEPADESSGFKSLLFKHREEEYLKKYDVAKQLLLDNRSKSQDSALIPESSLVGTLPLVHPEFLKRVRSLAIANKPVNIRLRKIPYSLYFDLWSIVRWAVFSFLAQTYLEAYLPNVYYIFVVVCYLISIKAKIDKHTEKELRKLPRDFLVKVLPERYSQERNQETKINWIYIIYETIRGFVFSFLPWFDPVAYGNRRNYLYAST